MGSEWIRKNEIDALRAGFISPYSMENGGEDIAELQSYYITTTPQKWEEKLNKAGKAGRTTSKINSKSSAVISKTLGTSISINFVMPCCAARTKCQLSI